MTLCIGSTTNIQPRDTTERDFISPDGSNKVGFTEGFKNTEYFSHSGSLIQQPEGSIQMKNLGGRVGSYAISTVDFNSWINEPVVQAPQRTRKTRGTKEVINKIFTDCANITSDPFWMDKFNSAATGKLPPKFSYHDGLLTYRKGAKCNTIEVSNNPYEASHACMEFFRVNGGIFSPLDEQNSLALQYSRAHAVLTQEKLTWGDANKKVQECMLSYYVIDMKSRMNLSDMEVEQLRQTIRLGISGKYFGKHNIHVDNKRIYSVDGLLWNEELRTFYINPDIKPSVTRSYTRKKDGPPAIDPSQKDMIPQFGVKWNKYVESLDKKIIRNARRQRRITVNHQGHHIKHLQLVTSPSPSTTTHTEIASTNEDEDDDYDDDDEE
jgi:hypothetical protein